MGFVRISSLEVKRPLIDSARGRFVVFRFYLLGRSDLNIESEVEDVSVTDFVVLAFQANFAGFLEL